jgi:hypothetical protein
MGVHENLDFRMKNKHQIFQIIVLLLPILVMLAHLLLSFQGKILPGFSFGNSINLVIYLLIPGLYISLKLKISSNLEFDEMVILNCLISLGVNTIVIIFMSLFLNEITHFHFSFGVFVFTIVTFVFAYPTIRFNILNSNHNPPKNTRAHDLYKIIGLVTSFVIGGIF